MSPIDPEFTRSLSHPPASRASVSVPAPDLAALKIMLEVIDKGEVWNDDNFDADCWEIVKADAARLRRATDKAAKRD